MKTKQRSLAAVLATLLFALALSGCANGQAAQTTVRMTELQKVMLAADSSLPEMISVTSDADDATKLFSYLSDFPYDKVQSFLLSYSATGKADEIAVIATKSPEDAAEAAKTLHAHLESRIKLFQQYGKEASFPCRARCNLHAGSICSSHHQQQLRRCEDRIHTASFQIKPLFSYLSIFFRPRCSHTLGSSGAF